MAATTGTIQSIDNKIKDLEMALEEYENDLFDVVEFNRQYGDRYTIPDEYYKMVRSLNMLQSEREMMKMPVEKTK